MSDWKKVKLSKVLKQYRIEHWVQDDKLYKQVSILNDGSVVLRGDKPGREIGRKRQFIIDIDKYPYTLIFTRQLLLQGSIGLANREVNRCIVTENMPMFSIEGIEPEYLHVFIKSEAFKEQVRALETTGSAQKSIHERQFLELEIPLPSIPEQKKLINEFKTSEENFSSVLAELAEQQTLIAKIRQSILQEAVQGKLAKQDKNDEPASELLKRIKAEKEKLIKQGKLKKEKLLLPVTEDEFPYHLPKGWEWCRLGEIGITQTGATPSTNNPIYFGSHIPFVGPGDMSNGKMDYSNKGLSKLGIEKGRVIAQNSILMVCIGGSIGKALIVDRDVTCNQQINTITSLGGVPSEYVLIVLNSPYFQKELIEKSTGSATPIINKGKWESIFIPLASLPEQKRIVAKVNQLMQQCNKLEQQVQQSIVHAQQLMQAVLREVFEQKEEVGYVQPEKVSIAAEPEKNSISLIAIQENKKGFAKQVLGGKIVALFKDDKHFTHIKFQKLQYLAEHIAKADLKLNYYRQTAGPYDPNFMHTVANKLKQSKWFVEKNFKYYPLEKVNDIDRYYTNYFSPVNNELSELFDLLKNATEKFCEAIATIYAVWNNRIIQKEPFDKGKIKKEFFEWSSRKTGLFTEDEFNKALDWMQKHNIIPTGFGQLIKEKK